MVCRALETIMRVAFLFLCCLIDAAFAVAQTTPHATKILTPGQTAYQQALKAYNAQIDTLRAAGNRAFAAEMARQKAPACPDARTTYEINQCLAHERDLTDASYKAFTSALRAMLALPEPQVPGLEYPLTGPSGPEATPATSTAAFNAAEAAWRTYAEAECNAVDTEWRGGTVVTSVVLDCNLRQARTRLQELDQAYSTRLHPH